VDVHFGRTPAEKLAAGISLAGLILALVLARALRRRPQSEPRA
jgi:hypothetical protein